MENPTVLERRILCFSSYKNRRLKLKLGWVGTRERKKQAFFVLFILTKKTFFFNICVILMYGVFNTLSKCTYFSITKNITSYTFLLDFKIVERFQSILKVRIWLQFLGRNLTLGSSGVYIRAFIIQHFS